MSNSELEILNKVKQTRQWWKDKAFTSELDYRYQSLENGTDRGYSLAELQTSINKLRKKSRI
jgi:hypothetical protein